MVDGGTIREFWAHWQHEPNRSAEFTKFRNRVFHVARTLWDTYIKSNSGLRERFAVISGTEFGRYDYFEHGGLYTQLNDGKTVFEIAEAVQGLLWTLRNQDQFTVDHCCRELQEVFELSPAIMIRLVKHGKTATLYPTGARLLDEAVVESNLVWLTRYPDVLKPFEEALKIYVAKDPNQYRNMLDNLRFALEQMLRIVLNNKKSLENQKEEFLRWLKRHDVHVRIGSMYHDLLFGGFAGYQNDAVKHQEDKYTSAEIEFVLYATGTFLRLIQRLVEQEGATKATLTVHNNTL